MTAPKRGVPLDRSTNSNPSRSCSCFIAALTCALLCAMTLAACGPPPREPVLAPTPPPPPPPPDEHTPPPVEQEPSAALSILSEVGFLTPESVVFDKRRDVYFVSNINGGPLDKDGNGFISKVTPQGQLTLKFIDGSLEGIDLDAPKGMTIAGDILYVADIDSIRKFDAISGKQLGSISVPGATFLNGLSTGEKGKIYASDSGR